MTFAFLPWLAFWSHGGSQIADLSVLEIGLSTAPDCGKVTRQFRATIARTNDSRSRGLGGRAKPLAADEGMLFLFDSPQRVTFWMKDTLIPLQLALFDLNGALTQLFEMPVEPDPVHPKNLYSGASQSTIATLELNPHTLNDDVAKRSYLCAESKAGK